MQTDSRLGSVFLIYLNAKIIEFYLIIWGSKERRQSRWWS